jgi:hypothetical protein
MPEAALRNFYEELKRRRVIRVATLYVVAIWPIIQLLDIISPTLDLPDSVLRYLVIASLISHFLTAKRISSLSVASACWLSLCSLSN